MGLPVVTPTAPTAQLPLTEVVGIGAATLDDFWLVPDFSAEEGVAEASNFIQMGGGPVATALCILARLGHSASLVDACGDDDTGRHVRKGLTACGVDVSPIQIVPGGLTARAVVLVRQSDGARQIRYLPASVPEPVWSSRLAALVQGARLLHLNGRHEKVARQAVAAAQSAGTCKISFDGGAGRYRDSLRDLVLASHIRILALDFARRMCGQMAAEDLLDALLSDGQAELVVVTDGVRGSYVALPGGIRFHQPAYPARPLVDTTGCGDVYHGAFLHGWLKHGRVRECAEFASRVAARNAEGLGGRFVCGQQAAGVF